MPKNWVSCYLNDTDLKEIESLVSTIEKATSAEVVPVLVKRSTAVGHVFPLTFFIMSSLVLALNVSDHLRFYVDWGLGNIVVLLALAALSSYFLSRFVFWQRLMTADEDMEKEVVERAELEFFNSRIKETESATGILLMVSFMEHQAVVLADRSISEKLPKETWEEVINFTLKGIKKSGIKQGIIDGLQKCGEILKKEFPANKNNRDELPNRLIIRDY